MKSNSQKRLELDARRSRRQQKQRERRGVRLREKQVREIQSGRALTVDRTKVRSRSVMPTVPDLYRDIAFTCKDCGKKETWTASQQKWWHEVAGGEIERIAIRCRCCRVKERQRRAAARKVHGEGLAKKKSRKSGASA